MAVVTFNGPIGAGGNEVGFTTSSLLDANYVDRLIFAEAAKRIGSTVAALTQKEEQIVRRRDRFTNFLQTVMERSVRSGVGGDPYFSPGMEYFPSEEYTDLVEEPVTAAQRLKDQQFIDVTSSVIRDLATAGDVIIIGRGSNVVLKDTPGVLHVGLNAPFDMRMRTIAEREQINQREAERFITDVEKARVAYFRKFFSVSPDDPNLYHMVLNMSTMGVDTAAELVAHAAKDISRISVVSRA
jgi:cytidylate kinase